MPWQTQGGANDITLSIDGSTIAAGSSSAVSLTGVVATTGSHEVSIATTGLLRAVNGRALIPGGDGCDVRTAGGVHAGDIGIDSSTGDNLIVQNDGIISAGNIGIRSAGFCASLFNTGSLSGTAAGIVSTGDILRLVNSGDIASALGAAVSASGSIAVIANSGTLTGAFSTLTSTGNFARIDKSGTIPAPNGQAIEVRAFEKLQKKMQELARAKGMLELA